MEPTCTCPLSIYNASKNKSFFACTYLIPSDSTLGITNGSWTNIKAHLYAKNADVGESYILEAKSIALSTNSLFVGE